MQEINQSVMMIQERVGIASETRGAAAYLAAAGRVAVRDKIWKKSTIWAVLFWWRLVVVWRRLGARLGRLRVVGA